MGIAAGAQQHKVLYEPGKQLSAYLHVSNKLLDRRHAVAQIPHLQGRAAVIIASHHQLSSHVRVPLEHRAAPLTASHDNPSAWKDLKLLI
jgi:hypothetical protein